MYKESPNNYRSCSSHCCVLHGCKYGYKGCPVVNRQIIQKYHCEECDTSFDMSCGHEVTINEKQFNQIISNEEETYRYTFISPPDHLKVNGYIQFNQVDVLGNPTNSKYALKIKSMKKMKPSLFDNVVEFELSSY